LHGRSLAALAALVGVVCVIAAVPASGRTIQDATSTYIVQLVQPPAAAYEGGIEGLKATAPERGTKLDSTDNDVVKYVGYLKSKHDEKLAKVGAQKIYDYAYSFDGFAAKLNPAQVKALQRDAEVLSVEKTEEVVMDTATTPAFLGLTKSAADGGLWNKGIKGEDVVIGILDSGIWPESKSFTDRDANGKLVFHQIPGFHGKCASTETVTDGSWDANLCNKKLIAAQFFCASRGCDTVMEHEFLSPRDFNGHGTHTASTAGGNEGVVTTGGAALFGSVNGIAPRARIAAYKVCWDNVGGCGANTGDSVAAIDQAVADGVDVINFSISGTRTNYLDSVEVAYLFAARAGVFVAASAGNNGPTATTVAHISPWLASVAAGTHNRSGTATVTLGNGATYTGASLTGALGQTSLVKSTAVGLAGKPADDVRLCFLNALDPALVAGKIVQCDRGTNARVEKSQEVKRAGGLGMVLTNVSAAESLNADLHSIPTVHVNSTDGTAIKTYIDSAGASATASLSQAVVNGNAPAPDVAAFSSRGPSLAGGGDIMKPDFMAPGVDILAAVAPPGNAGKDFDIYSGTSMSSPHVAGLGALLSQAHPNWSPAAMRSALATTADALSRAGLNQPFNTGSGHVRPNLSVDPGLVYDAGYNDYLSFLKGQRLCCATSASIPAIDASDLNQPSLAVGDLAGVQTLKRKVTNVGSTSATYTATISPPSGFSVTTPAPLTLAPGETKAFEVTITRVNAAQAPLNAYRFGALTWSDGTHTVRSPIVVRPVAIAAPGEISGTGASGSTSYSIKTGYDGALTLAKRGLIPAATTDASVADDPTDNFDTAHPDDNKGITKHTLVIPAGTVYSRISLFDAFTDGEDDLDLYVYSGGTLVGQSGGGTSAEEVNFVNPAAGTYTIYVHGWQTDGPDASYTLFTWALGTADAGNMTVTGPPAATNGGTHTVSLSWSGLTPSTKYLGSIAYQEGATTHASTIVRIDTP
jgi:subtilisin family serine protease